MSEVVEQLTKKVTERLTTGDQNATAPKNGSIRDIYTANFKEGPINREYRFYAPALNLSIEDPELRHKDREMRIWRLCKRYERYLRSIENRKVVFVGVPQPFVLDLEAKLVEFERNASKME
jgi:hypothetical protein